MTDELLEKKLSLRTVIGGGFVLISTAVAATVFVVSGIKESQIAALSVQLDGERQQSSPRADAETISKPTSEPRTSQELEAKISELEREKRLLVSKLTEVSRDSLSPDSELGGLVRQLESPDKKLRQAAAGGLFELNDARSVHALTEYYWRDPEEATYSIFVKRYMTFAWKHDRPAGIEFVMRVLQGGNPQYTQLAYEYLQEAISEEAFKPQPESAKLVSALENVALSSKDALVRTRAKLLLRTHTDSVRMFNEAEERFKATASKSK